MQECNNAIAGARRLRLHCCILAFLQFCLLVLSASPSSAGERYALVVTGASGGSPYAEKYLKWRVSIVNVLREKFGYAEDHLIVLAEEPAGGVRKATREGVQSALADFRRRVSKDDQLLVLLIGHGTAGDAEGGKFNLVGPDLTADEWAALLKPIAGKLVFIDTTGGSFPFLRKLAGHGRIVLTATDSAAQQFETVFPEYFIKAFDDGAADVDRNGRVSLWEAFSYASAGVRQWFDQRGQLSTERALLDDTGAGIGREAQNPGTDGIVARVTYLEPEASVASGDAALEALLKRKEDLEAQVEALKARKATMAPEQYQAELEKLLLELARVSQAIRSKT